MPLFISPALAVNSAIRRFLYDTSILNPNSVIVNEYPKSGGTWLSQLLAHCIKIPFPRHSSPSLFSPNIIHVHRSYPSHHKNTVYLFRDPRDVLVSLYHYSYFPQLHNARFINKVSNFIPFKDPSDITSNLPLFYEAVNSSGFPIRFTWKIQVSSFFSSDRCKIYTRYEDLLDNPYIELTRLLHSLHIKPDSSLIYDAINLYSFDNQKRQNMGNSKLGLHLRKGISGDWKNYLSPSLSQQMLNDMSSEMTLLGYE